MPIKSEQQRRFMAMCLHSPEKAKGKCPPKSVAKKFIHGHKKQEESNMNYINKYFLNESQKRINQEYRLGLKHLFESSVICQMEDPSRKVNEGKVDELIGAIYGGLKGLASGVKRGFGSDVRAVKSGAQALGSGARAAKKATGNAFLRGMQRFHNVLGGEGFKTDKQVDAGRQAEKAAMAKRVAQRRTQLQMRRDSDNFLQHGPQKPKGEADSATGVVMDRRKQGTFSF